MRVKCVAGHFGQKPGGFGHQIFFIILRQDIGLRARYFKPELLRLAQREFVADGSKGHQTIEFVIAVPRRLHLNLVRQVASIEDVPDILERVVRGNDNPNEIIGIGGQLIRYRPTGGLHLLAQSRAAVPDEHGGVRDFIVTARSRIVDTLERTSQMADFSAVAIMVLEIDNSGAFAELTERLRSMVKNALALVAGYE